jgi:hypothetical protein
VLADRAVVFELGSGRSVVAVTNEDGVASVPTTLAVDEGARAVAVRVEHAGSGTTEPSTTAALLLDDRAPTSLVYTGDLRSQPGAPVRLAARLTVPDVELPSPAPGRTVVFSVGDRSLRAVTDDEGLAAVTESSTCPRARTRCGRLPG